MPKNKSSLAEGFRRFYGLDPEPDPAGTRQALTDIWQGVPTAAGMAYAKLRGGELGVGPGDTLIARMPWESTHPSQTIGKLILTPKDLDLSQPMDKGIFTHEAGHVQQGDYFGPLTPLAAIAGGAVQALRGKRFYEDNPFETEAPRMGKERIENIEGRKSAAKPKKSYQEGTMPMRSKASFEPGMASAYQSPYAVGPVGGMGGGNLFGYMQGLMERQMKLKEAMARAQLSQMKEERKAAQQRLEQARKQSLMNETMFRRGLAPQMFGSKANKGSASSLMAKALHVPGMTSPENMRRAQMMIEAIGPQAAHEGLMQSGRILGSLGGEALRTAQPNPFAFPVQPVNPSGSIMPAIPPQPVQAPLWGGLPPQPALASLPGANVRTITGKTAEKGGRVPKTGTYKLHKGEIVLNKPQSDMMFPQAPKPSKGKAMASYQSGTLEDEARRRLAEMMTYSFASDPLGGPQVPPPPAWPEDYQPGPVVSGAETVAPTEGGKFLRKAFDYLMTPGSEIPFPGQEAPMEPAATDVPRAPVVPTSVPSMPLGPSPSTGIEGLSVSTSPKGVKQYTLTSKPESDQDRISRLRDDNAYFQRTADYYQQKADAMLQYAGENPSPDMMRIYQERQAVADRYKKRADQAMAEADKLHKRVTEAETAKEVEGIRQGGMMERADLKAQYEQMQKIQEDIDSTSKGIRNYHRDFLMGKMDRDAFVGSVYEQLRPYMPYLEEQLKGQGLMQENETIQAFLNQAVEEAARTGRMDAMAPVFFALDLATGKQRM